jgi:hypothetical protein
VSFGLLSTSSTATAEAAAAELFNIEIHFELTFQFVGLNIIVKIFLIFLKIFAKLTKVVLNQK